MTDKKDKRRVEESSYGAKYPYNRVMVTESGHEMHWDDTPGKERIRMAHKSGTYYEISAKGRKVEVVVGNDQKYNKGGVTLTIDHNQDVKIHGHNRIVVGGGQHTEVSGDNNTSVGGDNLIVVAGNGKIAIAGNAYIGVGGSADMNVKGNMKMNVKGDFALQVAGSASLNSSGTMSINSSGDVRIKEPGTADAGTNVQSEGATEV